MALLINMSTYRSPTAQNYPALRKWSSNCTKFSTAWNKPQGYSTKNFSSSSLKSEASTNQCWSQYIHIINQDKQANCQYFCGQDQDYRSEKPGDSQTNR